MTDATAESIQMQDDSDAEGMDAFLSNLTGEPTKKRDSTEEAEGAPEAPPNETEGAEEENTEGGEEPTQEGEDEQTEADPDDTEVEIKVGDETKKATIKELKRLYGQEASLTQKSQKLAEQVKIAETRHAQATTALSALLTKAMDRAKPYRELDMLVLSQRMETEAFEQLRADAAAAEADVKFLQQELGTYMQAEQQRTQAAYREAAAACIKALEDPQTGIKGWGKDMHSELSGWAESLGATNVRGITDPVAWRLLSMAHEWHKSQEAAKVAAAKVAKAPTTPTKVLRPGSAKTSNSTVSRQDALKRMAAGDDDAGVDAFLASLRG